MQNAGGGRVERAGGGRGCIEMPRVGGPASGFRCKWPPSINQTHCRTEKVPVCRHCKGSRRTEEKPEKERWPVCVLVPTADNVCKHV